MSRSATAACMFASSFCTSSRFCAAASCAGSRGGTVALGLGLGLGFCMRAAGCAGGGRGGRLKTRRWMAGRFKDSFCAGQPMQG